VTDRLIVSGLALFTHCGITPEERAVGQRVVADVEMSIEMDHAARPGGLETTVDYADVCRQISEIGDKARHVLLESLAIEVADAALARPRVQEVRVRITKPTPPIAAAISAFSVEVVRSRSRARS
jgi:dihydroneopterin aldolase